MSHVLTEASTYAANVTVPDDGDDLLAASVEAPFQVVADRTKYLKAHVDLLEAANHYGRYTVSGSPGSGANFTLTAVAANGLTLASNEVTIVTAGLYIVTLTLDITRNDATNPIPAVVSVYADAVKMLQPNSTRFSATVTDILPLNGTFVAQLSAGQKITVKAAVANLVEAATGAEGRMLSIGRIA